MKSIITQAQIDKLIDFLETSTISATFSSQGLTYLDLRKNKGAFTINLTHSHQEVNLDPYSYLIIKETLAFLETGKHAMSLDLSSLTAFQQQVFDAVSSIKPKTICTYKGLAELMGNPSAARAVGTAITKNPVSYFLPTHRVLPQKGIGICKSGAGYLREKLLEHEGHNLKVLRGNYVCKKEKCCME